MLRKTSQGRWLFSDAASVLLALKQRQGCRVNFFTNTTASFCVSENLEVKNDKEVIFDCGAKENITLEEIEQDTIEKKQIRKERKTEKENALNSGDFVRLAELKEKDEYVKGKYDRWTKTLTLLDGIKDIKDHEKWTNTERKTFKNYIRVIFE